MIIRIMLDCFVVYKVYLRYAIVVEKGVKMAIAAKPTEPVFERNADKRWRALCV